MEPVVAYMAPGGWYGCWLAARLRGLPEADARREADSLFRRRLGRLRLNRTTVAGAALQGEIRLTLPVEGSAATVKHADPAIWSISDHGRWRQTHLGALDAAYGSTPFYHHFIPAVADALMSAHIGEGSFAMLTERLHAIAADAMRIESLLPQLRDMLRQERERLLELRRDRSEGYTDEMSVFDVIFRKGPEAALILLDDTLLPITRMQ